jgi:uncharacterized HAD superfamily protein
MHIGIDLDNTVLDATSAILHCYNTVSGLELSHEDVNDFYLYRLYGWDKAKRDEVYYSFGHDIHWNSIPFPMAVETLQELFKQHQITIVTARPQQYQNVTMAWLEKYEIDYHHILLVEDKLQACISYGVDVLIDDAPHYAEELAAAQRPVILFEQPYNLSIANEYVYRAANWLEVKKQIDHLGSKFI